ncbi:MAG TPA: cyclodeaminase/cyclohydrolase family protein [Streptosporangiaceae bacterium]|nr:cyclodeaminase/cyclohydrolase family protein [Streptosporangiaceae bacterium]
MLDQEIGSWLDELASAAPAPGGGAAAAMVAAVGAGLIEMVCNLTIGKPRYAEHEEAMRAALITATELRLSAGQLAAADAAAFGAVSQAYRLPKESAQEKAARARAIQGALIEAADVPLRVAAVAAEVIGLSDRILAGANVNVISDVAVAASAGRAALDSAVINVEINLAAMSDASARAALRGDLDRLAPASAVADRVVAAVRHRIGGSE